MSTAIRKNTKAATRVFELATRCVVRSLDHGFVAREVEAKYAEQALHSSSYAKLHKIEDNLFRVSVHGNLWYDIFLEGA